MPSPRPQNKYQRVLLKLSGEAMSKPGKAGYDGAALKSTGAQIAEAADSDTQIAIVVGGGNIWRHTEGHEAEIERAASDTMGMLAGVMNCLALQSAIERSGAECRVQTAIQMPQVAEPYIRRRAIRHLEKGRVVIFAAGTGIPYFTHDTAAAVRALEIHAEVLLKGTKVDGIYESDPKENPKAKRYAQVTYADAIGKQLGVMDATAFTMCRDNQLPVVVFNMFEPHSLQRILSGETIGTTVAA